MWPFKSLWQIRSFPETLHFLEICNRYITPGFPAILLTASSWCFYPYRSFYRVSQIQTLGPGRLCEEIKQSQCTEEGRHSGACGTQGQGPHLKREAACHLQFLRNEAQCHQLLWVSQSSHTSGEYVKSSRVECGWLIQHFCKKLYVDKTNHISMLSMCNHLYLKYQNFLVILSNKPCFLYSGKFSQFLGIDRHVSMLMTPIRQGLYI